MKKIKFDFKLNKPLGKSKKIKKPAKTRPKKVKKKTVNRREFILIFVLVFMLEVYGLYTYLYQPIEEAHLTSQEMAEAETMKLNRLIQDENNKAAIQEELDNKKYQLVRLKERLPENISQEKILLSLDEYAQNTGLKIDSITFDELLKFGTQGEEQTPVSDDSEMPVILTKGIDVAYKGDTKAFCDFLVNLEKHPNKIIVTNMNLQGGADKALSGNISLSYFAYNEKNVNLLENIEIPKSILFRSNPFESFGSPVTDNEFADTTFHMLVENGENLPNVSLGRQYKPETEIYGSGREIDVKLTVSETGNSFYNCRYQVGEKVVEREEKLLLKEGKLNFNIMSHQRAEGEELMVNLTIENQTDIGMHVVIYGDDMVRPIVNMGENTGAVSLKRVTKHEP